MKRKTLFAGALALLVVLAAFTAQSQTAIETLAIGAAAPKADVKMQSTKGAELSLNDARQQNGLLVVFSCNTCPFVVGDAEGTTGWEGRYMELNRMAAGKNMGMVLVNSNEAKREKGDNLEDMRMRATEHGFSQMNYVLDKNSDLANAFGARTTPHVFLFDKDMKLVYRGAIDDNVDNPNAVKATYLKDAMGNLASGKPVNPNDTKPVGCSIKRVVQ